MVKNRVDQPQLVITVIIHDLLSRDILATDVINLYILQCACAHAHHCTTESLGTRLSFSYQVSWDGVYWHKPKFNNGIWSQGTNVHVPMRMPSAWANDLNSLCPPWELHVGSDTAVTRHVLTQSGSYQSFVQFSHPPTWSRYPVRMPLWEND